MTTGELRALAESVAREAGALLRDAFHGPELRVSAKSTPTDLVSEADHNAEHLIRERIAAARPDDGVLGEEGGDIAGTSGIRWVVDPLDGTVNFLFGIPQWAVSIACRGRAGHARRRRLRPDARRALLRRARRPADARRPPDQGLDQDATWRPRWSAPASATTPRCAAPRPSVAARLLPEVRDLRRFGAAAIDLAWTACGRLDAYYEHGLNAWDLAAGGLICERAGLEVRPLEPVGPSNPGVLVAPSALADAMEPWLA